MTAIFVWLFLFYITVDCYVSYFPLVLYRAEKRDNVRVSIIIYLATREADESGFQYVYTEPSQYAHLADRLGWYTLCLS